MDHAVEPHRIADDTWVIGQLHKPPGAPVGVYLNSMVIRGSEPIIVDTGTMLNREQWMADAFSLVEPEDVRWIFLSHDDHDHVGNLLPVMDAAPNATLVTSWFSLERLSGDYELPLDRVRWVNNGESFDAGDRRLTAITPPMFDAPTTRGLFDDRSGVYWAVDSFAAILPELHPDGAQVDHAAWRDGVLVGGTLISPWHQWLDPKKWGRHVDRVQGLGARAMASAHGPALAGSMIDEAFTLIRRAPDLDPFPLPTQADLEALRAVTDYVAA